MEGSVTIAMNVYNDICMIHKNGGAPVMPEILEKLLEACKIKVQVMIARIRLNIA